MSKSVLIYTPLQSKVYADMDNERIVLSDSVEGVLLSKINSIKTYSGHEVLLYEGLYVYLYMDIGEDEQGRMDYIFAEGACI